MKQMKKKFLHRFITLFVCLCMLSSTFIVAEAAGSAPEPVSGAEASGSLEEDYDTEISDSSEEAADEASSGESEETSEAEQGVILNDISEVQSDGTGAEPQAFSLKLKFRDKATKADLTDQKDIWISSYDGVSYHSSFMDESVPEGTAEAELQNLPVGSIYIFQVSYQNTAYYPDMDTQVGRENSVEFWLYIDKTGVKPINKNTFDDLMKDESFESKIDSLIKSDDAINILYPWLGMVTDYPNEEALQKALTKAVSSFPSLTATAVEGSDNTYEMTLEYSQRTIPPLKFEVVDKDGDPMADMPFRIGSISNSRSDKGVTGSDGVILDSSLGEFKNMPSDIYMLSVYGTAEKADGTYKTYIRKNAAATSSYPADYYNLLFYVGTNSIDLITLDNIDELNKDPQFQAIVAQSSLGYTGGIAMLKYFLMDDSAIVNENGTVKLPFIPWKAPTIKFRTVDEGEKNAPLAEINWDINSDFSYDSFASGETGEDGMITTTILKPGMNKLYVSAHVGFLNTVYEYMASHPMFRYSGKDNPGGYGVYNVALWVTLDGDVQLVDDAKLKKLCADEKFLDLVMRSNEEFNMAYLMGTKVDYSTLKKYLSIPGDYTLTKDGDVYLLPFTNDWDLTLSGTKDETVFALSESHSAADRNIAITYTCTEKGTYRLGWDCSSSYDSEAIHLVIKQGDNVIKEVTDATVTTVDLEAGTYTLILEKQYPWYAKGYFRVFAEKIKVIDPNADFHTADYIKTNGGYSNMVSPSCGTDLEHMILARYPGSVIDGSWALNVAVPTGTDFKEDSLKLYYLPDSAADFEPGTTVEEGYFGSIKDNLDLTALTPLDITPVCTKAESFRGKTIYSLVLNDVPADLEIGDLLAVTYTNTVNTAAWYGSITDSNMSYGYWSMQDADSNTTVETYDTLLPIPTSTGEAIDWETFLVDPAIFGVFGIKIYKYSNYDRMLAASAGGFDTEVLLQEHLLSGAEFKLEGENLSKMIVITDKLVEEGAADQPTTLSAGEEANEKLSAGAALAKYMDDDTLMKLLYYRYEQGIQQLSNVSVGQTQTYYALNEDDLYTHAAPKPETIEFYADNGQGYQLKPMMYTAEEGETIQAGDGGGLLLGGLGAGEYTLTEVKAPDGYTLIQPMKISIEWVKEDGYTFEKIDTNEVPDRSGKYGLVCKINGEVVETLTGSGNSVWFPIDHPAHRPIINEFPDYASIWNPACFVVVNPIGDDRISFASVKEVNDPADKGKEFELKFTIKDPDGKICTNVKYAVCNENGQYVTQDEVIDRAENWTYQFKPGKKIAFVNLLEGSSYEVTEENGETSEYIVSYQNEDGTIQYDGDNYPTAVVTNKKGELVITKTVTGAGDTNKEFNFQVKLKDGEGNELKDVTCIKGKTESKLSSGETIQLKHGESVTLYVPVGTQYKVTELEANKDGYTTKVTNEEGTISGEEPILVSFNNEKTNPIIPTPTYTSVTVNKVWKLDDGGKAADSVTVALLRNGVKDQTVTLNAANNWSYIWKFLDTGYTWTVEEINVPEGFESTVQKTGSTFVITNDDQKDKPDDPTKPDDPNKPDDPTKPDNPDKPDKPDKPAKPGKPDKPTKPSKPGKVDPDKSMVPDEGMIGGEGSGSNNMGAGANGPEGSGSPQTGDSADVTPWFIMMGISAAALAAILLTRRKKAERHAD